MGVGKVFAIIGGVLGVLSVLLYYAAPEIFCLWRLVAPGMLEVYIGGFGAASGEVAAVPFPPEPTNDIILVIVSVLIIGGSVLTFIAGLTESKIVGILGGIILLAGPILFLVQLIAKLGFFGPFAASWLPGENLLFGSFFAIADWGIYIGAYLAIGGGLLGIIGGATI